MIEVGRSKFNFIFISSFLDYVTNIAGTIFSILNEVPEIYISLGNV